MSISSNNAIDKRRQLKQAEVAEEQQKKQAWGGVGCRLSSEAWGKFVRSYAPVSCCMIKIDIKAAGREEQDVLAPRQLPSNFKLKEAQN